MPGSRVIWTPALWTVPSKPPRMSRTADFVSRAHGDAEVPAAAGLATVTVGDLGHDVALSGDQVVVGRLAECQIHLDDANVSRRRAAFVRLDAGWAITDLGSTNGTRVNGEPVERVRLRDGDVIEIGLARLVYHEPRG